MDISTRLNNLRLLQLVWSYFVVLHVTKMTLSNEKHHLLVKFDPKMDYNSVLFNFALYHGSTDAFFIFKAMMTHTGSEPASRFARGISICHIIW